MSGYEDDAVEALERQGYYADVKFLVETREVGARQQLAEGDEWITLKPPSGYEVEIHRSVVVDALRRLDE